ncbi:hypothetical protein C1872_02535 [Eggerthella lenta]|uniref:MATE family efflux transporter n=1 Tax=Eggerthella lenta TaxID=84112 RepID=A0A369NHH5_EGGLN|nr:hypothetical protein C1872_02535 [Eggerthella lenta]RDC04860.1 hypothetical protein C1864_08800 [Eggerthella lenta]RDC18475.1 hypothetical protein C1858_14595 [Eggerthella lenta]RDC19011.1 hypothetical protein C1859_08175 [Eggerthella lenta]
MESSQRDISDERDARRPDGRDELDKSNSPATRPKRNRRDKRDNGIDMLNGPLPGKILRFAIPLALSSILQQLLNSADASIAGQFVSSFSLAGIGGVNPVTAMFVNLFVGLSIGANVVVAMHVGAGEFHSIKKSVHTAMALSLIAGWPWGRPGSPWPPGCWTPSACPKTPSPTRSPMCGFTSAPFRSSPSTTSGRRYCGPTAMRNDRCMPSLPPLW